jgi:hypothetical protein
VSLSFMLIGLRPFGAFRQVRSANTAGTRHSGTHKVSGTPEHKGLG